MSAIPKRKLTPEEYLEIERQAEYKSEYFGGEIYAMAGAKRRHNVIAWNIGGELRQKLKGKNCEAYPADMRVFVPQTGLYTYPDLVVVCGEPQFQDDVFDTLLNPGLIIEVLSSTTEQYDRGKKFQHYRSIESLQEYVLVSQDEARIEKYVKSGDGFWMLSEAVGLDAEIEFASIECRVALAEVYDKVDFPMNNARQNLIRILQNAYSGELAAAYAYRGHWQSLRKSAAEREKIKQIEAEEWTHRVEVGKWLAVLEAKPRKFKEAMLWTIGRSLGAACHISGWFFPMYFAGRLESGNVKEYEDAAQFAKELEMPDCYDELMEMARVEQEHEDFFRSVVAHHRLLPITRRFFHWS